MSERVPRSNDSNQLAHEGEPSIGSKLRPNQVSGLGIPGTEPGNGSSKPFAVDLCLLNSRSSAEFDLVRWNRGHISGHATPRTLGIAHQGKPSPPLQAQIHRPGDVHPSPQHSREPEPGRLGTWR